jgi:hypothetical protein
MVNPSRPCWADTLVGLTTSWATGSRPLSLTVELAMKKRLIALLLLVVAAAGVGYWRGWFDFKKTDTNDGKANVGATVNKDKFKAPVTRSESQAVSPTVVQFLLTAAATDFHTHRPQGPVRFRDVRIGHVMTTSGEKQYRLCGQFLPAREAGKAEWTPFATIKTSGYEQYTGAQAAAFCQDSSVTWANVDDLSSSLQSRLDSLR